MKLFYHTLAVLLFFLFGSGMQAQYPQTFERSDFQLMGPVKRCVVKAPYGTETYDFDRQGRLVQTEIRYNEGDYDITYYRFADSLLKERRDEVYRDKAFDARTSIAHFYSSDSTSGRLTEIITSYDKAFREQLDRYFNPEGKLIRIVNTTAEGTDETLVEYSTYKGEETASYLLNGTIVKSVRHSQKEVRGQVLSVELTKEYLEGNPQKAVELVRNSEGSIVSEVRYGFDEAKDTFQPVETHTYTYDDRGLRASERIEYHQGEEGKTPGSPKLQKFIYQMDGADPPNWVRQITTPENTFIVRSIEYYEPEAALAESDSVPD